MDIKYADVTRINEERGDQSFMGIERVSWGIKLFGAVSTTWMSWKLGHKTSTEDSFNTIKTLRDIESILQKHPSLR